MKRAIQSNLDSFVKKREKRSKNSNSVFVECPICCKKLHTTQINEHLDNNCNDAVFTHNHDKNIPMEKSFLILDEAADLNQTKDLIMTECRMPPGLYLINDFLSFEEEDYIIRSLDGDDSNPWELSFRNGCSYVKKWGRVTDYSNRTTRAPDPSKGEHTFPPYC